MKKISFLFIIIILGYNNLNFSQTIYSNGTGGGLWSASGTWLGNVVPTVNDDVVIAGTDSVYTTAGAKCQNLTVLSGGRFATSVDTVQVVNTLTLEDNAWCYNLTSEPNLPGTSYFLDPQSYAVEMGTSGSVGSVRNSEFGNLVIMKNNGCTPGANLTVNGNLIVNNLSIQTFRAVRSASQTHTVYGDVYIYKGVLSCVDASDPNLMGIWNIHGSVYVIDDGPNYLEARIGPFSSANAAGLGIINIDGDLVLQGGRLQAGTSSSHGLGAGIINVAGNVSFDINSAVATNHEGPFSLNFVGSGTQNVNLDVKFQMSTSVYDTIAPSANVVFDLDTNKWSCTAPVGGNFVVNGSLELVDSSYIDGPQNFILNSGGTLKVGSPNGIMSSGTSSNIKVSGTRTFSSDAYYEYKSNVPQLIGDGLPSTIRGFTLNNSNGMVLTKDLNISSTINILKGQLDLVGNNITLAPDAILTETPGNTITGSVGKITITKDLNAPSTLNVGGLGAIITSSSNLGSTTVERYHYIPSGGGAQGISRVYNIVPTNNAGLGATLKLNYDDSELNGIDESKLGLYQSATGNDNSWAELGGTVNTSQNNVELGGLNNLSYFTLGDVDSPLPVEEEKELLPKDFALEQNYPNPFNPTTVIKYQLPQNSFVSIIVYDVLGNRVTVLENKEQTAGYHSISFDGSGFASGVYFCTMKTDNFTATNKMILIK